MWTILVKNALLSKRLYIVILKPNLSYDFRPNLTFSLFLSITKSGIEDSGVSRWIIFELSKRYILVKLYP